MRAAAVTHVQLVDPLAVVEELGELMIVCDHKRARSLLVQLVNNGAAT